MKKLILIYLVLLTVSVAMAQRFPPGALVSSKKAAVGGGGLPAWFDSEVTSNENATDFTANSTTMLWQPITIGASGNATKLRYWNTFTFGSFNVKVGLYSSGGSLLKSVEIASGTVDNYMEGTITSEAVTSGSYYIAWIFDNGNPGTGYNNASGTISVNNAQNYASGLPASLPSSTSTFTGKAILGVYVE